jgi:aerobic carbon-monoxide dehydrogenase small subunit
LPGPCTGCVAALKESQLKESQLKESERVESDAIAITLTVNGVARSLEVSSSHTLLRVLRDQLGLTGTKECCSMGECGACTVLVDGRAVNSCLMLAAEADGCHITTIEGLSVDGRLNALQEAFLAEGAVQCGFCIPGMVMSAQYLLDHNPSPTEEEIKEGLAGNLCRCAGYSRIIDAVRSASSARGGK